METDFNDMELRYGVKKKILLNIPNTAVKRLDEVSSKYGISRAALIREALALFLIDSKSD